MRANVTLPISEAAKRTTFKVRLTGVRTFKLRFWIGMRLIKLGVRVIGCGIEIK